MNIKLLDSWIREYLKTDATPKEFAEKMSLTSVSIERIEPHGNDFIYDIEITTNRPDLMSVSGLAREAAAVLPQAGIKAAYTPPVIKKPTIKITEELPLTISNDPKLVNRICGVVMEVNVKQSPATIKDKLETSDIRSLNNLIDITNYVMRVIGHPTHVFDYDRLTTKTMIIRESKKGEIIKTLDDKTYTLPGGDIVADNGEGEIIDLLGIMGTANSVVTDDTKRILFFLDNNDPIKMRKTSMALGIRSEAAQINEKSIDPELGMDALLYGIQLFQELADAKVVSPIIDIYPNKPEEKTVTVSEEKMQTVIGVPVTLKEAKTMLDALGFKTSISSKTLTAKVPSFRANDIAIPEDIIEEVARVYGYHNIPTALPPVHAPTMQALQDNALYWENRIKQAMKYWGFTETYTYSMVSEALYEGPTEQAVKIKNPLTEDFVYMRSTLIPSMLQIIREHKNRDQIKIFEIANTYHKRAGDLPEEKPMLAGIIKKPGITFYHVKGIVEQLLHDLGINNVTFRPTTHGGLGASILIEKEYLGEIEILENDLIDFELQLNVILTYATLRKVYTPIKKYPPIIEDLAFTVSEDVMTGDLMTTIKKQHNLIVDVQLLDKYQTNRTFRVVYQDANKNLTSEDIAPIRENIQKVLDEKYGAKLK